MTEDYSDLIGNISIPSVIFPQSTIVFFLFIRLFVNFVNWRVSPIFTYRLRYFSPAEYLLTAGKFRSSVVYTINTFYFSRWYLLPANKTRISNLVDRILAFVVEP